MFSLLLHSVVWCMSKDISGDRVTKLLTSPARLARLREELERKEMLLRQTEEEARLAREVAVALKKQLEEELAELRKR